MGLFKKEEPPETPWMIKCEIMRLRVALEYLYSVLDIQPPEECDQDNCEVHSADVKAHTPRPCEYACYIHAMEHHNFGEIPTVICLRGIEEAKRRKVQERPAKIK